MTVQSMRSQRTKLSGWGNFPVMECGLYEAFRASDAARLLTEGPEPSHIARGLGRSYGDTALNDRGGVLLTRRMNKMLSFDPAEAALECEAGVTFEEIVDVFLPRGYFLPVTPGTKSITVGGAIANDVHGKNHHRDGCFSNYVLSMKLLLPDGTIRECSPTRDAELFWATAGGIGLTGVILSARFRLMRVESAYMRVDYYKARDLDDALERFERTDDRYRYSVAWIDCLASGKRLGRSVLMQGEHLPAADLPNGVPPWEKPRAARLSVPFPLPSATLNAYTVARFNDAYYGMHRTQENKRVGLDAFFYPLDSIRHWNRMYGKRGFLQYQFVLPPETSRSGLIDILELLSANRRSSFLAVLKRFGPQGEGWLSFPKPGYTLALDLPMAGDAVPFLRRLDEIVLRSGGRLYLAKDAAMTPETLAASYPNLESFLRLRAAVDPHGRLASAMSRRLQITR